MQKNLIVTLLFSILIAFFAILNAAAIPVNLIFVTVDVSAALVILIAASLGAILVYSLDIAGKMRMKKAIKSAEKELSASKESVVAMEREYNDEIRGLKNEIAVLETQLDEIVNAPVPELKPKLEETEPPKS